MKTINVVNGPQNVPVIIQGCMRMPALSVEQAAKVIRNAYDLGVNFYDHATCYGPDGEAEKRFGEAFPLTGLKREDVFLQSKWASAPSVRSSTGRRRTSWRASTPYWDAFTRTIWTRCCCTGRT